MLPLRRAWRHNCLPSRSKRQLSLAYNLHEPHKPEPGHASLILLHGLFGSKQTNRSISKYGLSRPALQVSHLIGVGHLHKTSKRQFMRLSVFHMAAKKTRSADYPPGFEEPWRLTPWSSARLFSDGGRRRGVHPKAKSAFAYSDRTFNVGFHLLHNSWTKLKVLKGRKSSNDRGTAVSSTCRSFDTSW